MTILSYVAFAISIFALIATLMQSKKLFETKIELEKEKENCTRWINEISGLLQVDAIKDFKIKRLEKTIEALRKGENDDERRNRKNSCSNQYKLSVLLPRYECGRKKGNH